MPDHDDLVERLIRLRDRLRQSAPFADWRADTDTLAEAANRLSGERITLWRCPECGYLLADFPDYAENHYHGGPHCEDGTVLMETFTAVLSPEGEGE